MAHSHRQSSKETPWGIMIIALLGGLGGLVGLVGSFGLVLEGGLAGSAGSMLAGGLGIALGVVLFLFAVAQLIVSMGLLTLKSWAFKWSLALFALDGLLDLALANVFGLAINVVVIAYLVFQTSTFLKSGVDYK